MYKVNEITNEVLTSILKGIDEGIHVVNTEGMTIFYNEVAARHDGLNISEVIGKPLLTVFPSLDRDSSTLLQVMKTRKAIFNQAQSYVNFHGKRIETMNTTMPIIVQDQLVGAVEIAKDYSRIKLLSEKLLDLQKKIQHPHDKKNQSTVNYTIDHILTINPSFIRIKEEAKKLAKSQSSILVYGESGSGKELFVQGIHEASLRKNEPFIAQNCAAIPESLLESILFGTSKGSYTGAVERAGLFEIAHKGTLFLDELHTMSHELQAKLLRVLEDGIVRRVGSGKSSYVDVRVIAAMNVDPQKAIEEGVLRPDLFYRLNVLSFQLLPLRERKEDIMYLGHHFIDQYNKLLHKRVKGVNDRVEAILLDYPWPGNVRELKHAIEYMVNISEEETLTEKHLPFMVKNHYTEQSHVKDHNSLALREHVVALEKSLIEKALRKCDGNIKKAAKLLEIPRQTLQYKMTKYRLK
ncbi:sigma 54-interacting transcriptional regulator [Cytobacillus spongiae]|jgi:arginine utilization regulatory protein|uniref:sigma-54 interaction domain-containing protein n=1 Tax=Cytobacillus spongiae TaxID=2901381 RepID=UPI001F267EA5|nr:sigma 54-interacting transcriptional regulator [Cytobacillus spongiae]UII54485.1 sigma 54-interacting transcriptional regulator [Cytobacillus spongiae]